MATPYPLSKQGFFLAKDTSVEQQKSCDMCGQLIEGEPAGEGVYVWSRAGQTIHEQAPLCHDCSFVVCVAAHTMFEIEDEG